MKVLLRALTPLQRRWRLVIIIVIIAFLLLGGQQLTGILGAII